MLCLTLTNSGSFATYSVVAGTLIIFNRVYRFAAQHTT